MNVIAFPWSISGESDTHNGGATRPRVHLGGDYFIVLYSGNNFKCFHFFYPTNTTLFIQLDWPKNTGVRVINLPPSRGPNSLFLVVSEFPEHLRSFDGLAI